MRIHRGGAKREPKKGLNQSIFVHKKNKSNKEQKFLKSKPLSTKHFVRPKLRKFDYGRKNFPNSIFVDKAFLRFSNVAWPETFFVLIHCKCLTNNAMIIMTLGLCNRKNIRAEERLKNKNCFNIRFIIFLQRLSNEKGHTTLKRRSTAGIVKKSSHHQPITDT